MQTLTLIRPDDWHIHLRDDKALDVTAPHAAQHFSRVMCMPNLVPPITQASQATHYRDRILKAVNQSNISNDQKTSFDPRMVLYPTDNTTTDDIKTAKASGIVQAVKLYPAGQPPTPVLALPTSRNATVFLKQCKLLIYHFWCTAK